MAREYEGQRHILERLYADYPQEVLKTREVCKILGLCKNTVLKRVPMRNGGISKEALSRWICQNYG